MKKNKLKVYFLAILGVYTLFSCENEPVDFNLIGNPTTNSNNNYYFKIDEGGTTFNANSFYVLVDFLEISIRVNDTVNQKTFFITIPNLGVGVYNRNIINTADTGFTVRNGFNYFTNIDYVGESDDVGPFASFPNYTDNFEVIISSIDTSAKTITGTIRFTGVKFAENSTTEIETKEYTNGTFYLNYEDGYFSEPNSNQLYAKIDGVGFYPNYVGASVYSGKIQIEGYITNTNSLYLDFYETISPGTYLIKTYSGVLPVANYDTGLYNQYYLCNENQGVLTITSNNSATRNVVGKFEFLSSNSVNSTDTKYISEGTFNVNY